ncbi:HemD protein [Paenibacillus swuensis]|uniref:Uroporphyrinogen-III C-methyltransferase n=1 Tax=Paenibacillus swuensis TaxID=1178515 RepID=A0A172TJC6_9BACL|nr:uroporphyrinogen-III C-methyltransferase [Paenibacillus swuensis]ANE47155.1 HemD protein [Paenibacillus swuensis]
MKRGKVYLVGAGPGDPKLITLRGLECIQRADVVVYDRLASPRLLRHMKPGAEKVYVGKLPDRHTMKQEDINQLLADIALTGKTVTRLKGGDPSIFGRVAEEAELLVDNGIEFEIIPGITSAIAVPTYAGIPVTHREIASSLSIITGHENPEKLDQNIDWAKLTNATGTLIFLMGVAKIGYISEQLIRYGRSPQTPVALIRWGTRVEQRTLTGTLETIAELVRQANFQPPAVIVVGEVVLQRDKLQWYEKKPLFGKRVLVTRARSQASELADRIDELGGEAVEFPVIRVEPVREAAKLAQLRAALAQLDTYDWLVFTSPNGVEHFFRSLREAAADIRAIRRDAKIVAVGPKTAEALAERGLAVHALPAADYRAEGVLDAIRPELAAGQRVLLPRGDLARAWLPAELTQLGLAVTEVDVYETVPSGEDAAEIAELLRNKDVHIVTFTSSSTVTHLLDLLKQAGEADPHNLLQDITVVCIGPLTAETALKAGIQVHLTAKEATIDSLVDSLVNTAVSV